MRARRPPDAAGGTGSGGRYARAVSRWQAELLELGRLRMGPDYPGPGGAFSQPVDVPVNALLLRGRGEAVLVDTGAGLVDRFWPGAAGLERELERVACDPAAISRVVVTHLDFDHSGGLVTGRWPDALAPAFPNARVALLGDGLDWWRARDPDAPFNAGTRVIAELAARGRLDEAADGDEVADGIRIAVAPGHRAGHACVVVEGELLHLADVVHHPAHMAHPEWDPAFDAEPETAYATRLSWLARAADTGLRVVHAHVAGAGRVVRDGGGFRWVEEARATVGGER
jgi:glyoxylase-like metal-dependent hydrolase (beta-lactamase superfamily II)